MNANNLIPSTSPGEILQEEFLTPLKLTAYKLAKETHISQTRISEILKAKRGITANTALKLAAFFGNSAQFWLNLQTQYDLEQEKEKIKEELLEIHPLRVG